MTCAFCRASRMPFLPARVDPPVPGVCSSCAESGRVWRFGEETVESRSGYTLWVSHALCQDCLDVIVDLLDEDID
ncbi:hypothetical protein UFOVP394_41 [uncultured Caudovirales phage]|jgi:hypothetical protein|uniref:Uncharacterized protein n=1 Tax=uncultured Caudovirales phage TaxID=2100421 RepID=A0A6J7X771_9CAUD|nr:hypothetical protein UFOVP394_41 [uncultured Caudovirales phage]